MINHSIKNFIFFLVPLPTPIPLRIEEYQRNGGTETKQDPGGPPWYKSPTMSPHFLFVEKGFSLLDPPQVPKSRLKQLLIREVRKCRNKGKQSRNNNSVIKQSPSSPQGIHITI